MLTDSDYNGVHASRPAWNRIVLLGASGLLGTEFHGLLKSTSRNLIAPTRNELDLFDAEQTRSFIQAGDLVINCVAWTAVDAAEVEQVAAFALNAELPRLLAAVCNRVGAKMMHFSTDYVFGKRAFGVPIPTNAEYSPNSVYGRSKMEGELAVLSELEGALVLRTAWLYGAGGRNFVDTVIRRLLQGEEIRVVADQFGQPTWARSLAQQAMSLANSGASGVFHTSSTGHTSWFGLAARVAKVLQLDQQLVSPIRTSEYPTAASRPHWSVLDPRGLPPGVSSQPSWERQLDDYLSGRTGAQRSPSAD